MPPTPDEKGLPDGIWPDEGIIRPPIEVLGENGVTRSLDEEAEGAAHSPATTGAGHVHWLEERVAAQELRNLAAAAGAFTAKVSWEPCGPGDVVLGWVNAVFTEDSRVFASVVADPQSSGSQHPPQADVILRHVRSQAGTLLIRLFVGGEQAVRPRVDILVVNP